jgi:serine protease AprX
MRGAVRTTAVLAALSTVTAMLAAPGAASAGTSSLPVDVVVRYDSAPAAETAVARAGGTVGRRLESLQALTARVPRERLAALRAADAVVAVTLNAPVRLKGKHWMAEQGLNSMSSVARSAGAVDAWTKRDASGRKVMGTGVGVALIDSGIAPVKGLAGKVINGPDLSFESQAPHLRYLDTFGHGTHLAASSPAATRTSRPVRRPTRSTSPGSRPART